MAQTVLNRPSASEKPPPSVPQFPHLKYMIEGWSDPTDRSLTSRRLGEAEAWIRDHPPTYTHTLGLWLAQPSRKWLVERCDFYSRQSTAASGLSGHRSDETGGSGGQDSAPVSAGQCNCHPGDPHTCTSRGNIGTQGDAGTMMVTCPQEGFPTSTAV